MPAHSSDSRPGSSIQFGLSAAVLLLAGLLGGSNVGTRGDTLVQLLAIILLGWIVWSSHQHGLSWKGPVWARWLPALAIALPIFQLLPVPEAIWASSPARTELAAQLAQVKVTHGSMLSLNPGATERALWFFLPPSALFLSALTLSRTAQRRLLALVLVVALANFLLGLFQLGGGQHSELRFYLPTNPNDAVGFFANRNHFAGLLAMSLPLAMVATGWSITERLAGREISVLWCIAGCTVVILLILGIAVSRSRAGLLLGMLSALASLPIAWNLRGRRGTKRLLAVAMGLALVLSVQFALFGMLQRLAEDPLDDGRWQYARITREAAAAYAPFGSGLGTFRQAYQPFEVNHKPTYSIVNHAHDDYLELWLEGGWPALALMALGALDWACLCLQLLRRGPEWGAPGHSELLLARTACLAGSVALLHTAFDYPLRTTAAMAVFSLLAAVAFSGLPRREAGRVRGEAHDRPVRGLPAGG